MIPSEIADLADLVRPGWSDLEGDELAAVISAAGRIHAAGYRKQNSEPQ